MRASVLAVAGGMFIAFGTAVANLPLKGIDGEEAFKYASWWLIAPGIALILLAGVCSFLSRRDREYELRMQGKIDFARVEMRAILTSMVYQAMKERQDELSLEEEIKLRTLLAERAGIELDDEGFEALIKYAKSNQKGYMDKIAVPSASMSHEAKLMIVKMSYWVIVADREVEKNEVETILEIAGLMEIDRAEAVRIIEDIDRSREEIAAALAKA